MHPLFDRLLKDRGIENADAFLNPLYETRPSPFLMKGMNEAVARVYAALEAGERVAVWSDYDCDGIPAGALLADFFRAIGHPIRSYIPERSEGYGMNEEGISKLKEEGVSLIITADVGITNVPEVAFANSLGIDVIVTDHHLPQERLPDTVAVLNPHQTDCPYPFKELCGTGVAFKLVEALIRKNMDTACPYFSWREGQEKWLLDLVALATVADMVPLIGENRALVHFGLVVLRKGRRKGLTALFEASRAPLEEATEDDLSFSIAPKINAASRMESPLLALELLTTKDAVHAHTLAKRLVKLNDERKIEGARVAKEVKRRLEGRPLDDVIVLGSSEWKPALLGIAATNVVETYGRTVCLWGKEGDLIKGSCRSDGSVNIVSLMERAGGVFLDFGGHERSGGFSLKRDAVHRLEETLAQTHAALCARRSPPSLGTDEARTAISVSIAELNENFYRSLRSLAPFGIGNEKPLFSLFRVRVERVVWFGSHQEHARLTVSNGSGETIDAINFFASRSSCADTLRLISFGDVVSVTGSFEQSFFGNKRELRLRLESLELTP